MGARLGQKELRALEGLSERLRVVREGEPAMGDEALAALEAIGIEYPHSYRFHDAGGRLELSGLTGRNFDVRRLGDSYLRLELPQRLVGYEPLAVAQRERNRAILSHELAFPERLVIARTIWRHAIPGAHDQVRALVCDGPAMLAWVGGFSCEDFDDGHRLRLQALLPALRERLLHEQRLRDAALVHASLTAVVEAMPGPAWLLDASRRVVHRNRAAGEEAPPAAGGEWTPIEAAGLPRHWLLRAVSPPQELSLREFSARYALTAAEARVLGLIAAGRSNRAVAAALRCSERTVEIHVTRLLEKTDCESRGMLVAQYWKSANW